MTSFQLRTETSEGNLPPPGREFFVCGGPSLANPGKGIWYLELIRINFSTIVEIVLNTDLYCFIYSLNTEGAYWRQVRDNPGSVVRGGYPGGFVQL